METQKEIKSKIRGADTLSKKNGIYTIRQGFYYKMERSEEKLKKNILEVYPNAEIIDSGEHWAAFRGGQTIASGSHFWVKFKLIDANCEENVGGKR